MKWSQLILKFNKSVVETLQVFAPFKHLENWRLLFSCLYKYLLNKHTFKSDPFSSTAIIVATGD